MSTCGDASWRSSSDTCLQGYHGRALGKKILQPSEVHRIFMLTSRAGAGDCLVKLRKVGVELGDCVELLRVQ